jgi:hypothetical protein
MMFGEFHLICGGSAKYNEARANVFTLASLILPALSCFLLSTAQVKTRSRL